MRLITWNTAARVKTLSAQMAFLRDRKPDIVAIQEVTHTTYQRIIDELEVAGFAMSSIR